MLGNAKAWDFKLGPAIGLDISSVFADEESRVESEKDLADFSRAALHLMGSVTGHTPLGAFTFALGGGPAYYYLDGEAFPHPHEFGGEFVFAGHYTAFMGEYFMVRMFVDLVRPSGNIACGRIEDIAEGGLVFGYYFDAIDTWTKGWF